MSPFRIQRIGKNRNERDSDVLGPPRSLQPLPVALGIRSDEHALCKAGRNTLGSFPLGSHCDLAVPQENLLSPVNALTRVTYSQSKYDRSLPAVIRLWFVESVRNVRERNANSLDIYHHTVYPL